MKCTFYVALRKEPIMNRIEEMRKEIEYRKKEMSVCAVSKRDIYELEELEQELKSLEEMED